MEHTCENCNNQKIVTVGYIQYMDCKVGNGAFYECQVACTDDYFEPKKPTILEGACFNYKREVSNNNSLQYANFNIDQEEKDIDRTVKYLKEKYIDK